MLTHFSLVGVLDAGDEKLDAVFGGGLARHDEWFSKCVMYERLLEERRKSSRSLVRLILCG